jgi:hypothetical protein
MGGNEPKARPGSYKVSTEISGSPEWQTISVGVEDFQADSKGIAASPAGNWEYIADVTVAAKVEGIRKIYWAKASDASVQAAVKPTATGKVTKAAKAPVDDLPELAGQSEEFKEAVRQSLIEEKKKK